MTDDERYMRQAVEVAERGRGLTSPGAIVGAVLVRGGEVVGEGFYTWDGVSHAEVLAIRSAGEKTRGATLYVTLEPCCHTGRTPPCVDAIVGAGVARVVGALDDPNPKVHGRGFQALKRAGLEVESGVLADEARQQNEAFLHRARSDRPFTSLKVAMTLDGKIATASGESRWITSEESRARVHRMRHAVDAILTGSGTVLKDNPRMTDRSGLPRRRPLLRAAIDRRGRLGARLDFFGEPGALVYTALPHLELPPGHEVVVGVTDLEDVARDLARRDIQSMMIECGPELAFDALRRGIVDKIVVFVAPRIIGGREVPAFGAEGVATLAEAIALDDWTFEQVGPDLMVTGYVHRDR